VSQVSQVSQVKWHFFFLSEFSFSAFCIFQTKEEFTCDTCDTLHLPLFL